tara:strand:+ start:2679 stop:3692 length:1014 start_codon:yes stop_codon:yes gene_type:complete
MAQTILIKRSTGTATPSSLSNGELAYSASSNKLFIGRPGGGTGDIDAIGGKHFTDIITGATAANTASKLVLRDGSGNFSAGTITASLTGNASTATALQSGRTIAITGDLAYTSPSFDGSGNITAAGTLATVNSNVGSFGSTTAIPVITVNAKGLITGVTTSAISTSFTIAADSGSNDTVAGGETLTFSGGTGVATTVSNNAVTFAIGQAVGTTSNVTFNNVEVDGTLTSDDITSTNISVAGNATITGNLIVQGTTTTVNSNTVSIGDNIIVLNKDETGTPSQNAGIEIERGSSTNVSLLWNEGSDYWQVNDGSTTSKLLTAGNFAASFTGTLDGGSF